MNAKPARAAASRGSIDRIGDATAGSGSRWRGPGRALAIFAAAAGLAWTVPGCGQPTRTLNEVVRDLENLRPPKDDKDVVKTLAFKSKRAELIGELCELAPDKAGLAELLSERWDILVSVGNFDEVLKETDAILADEPLAKRDPNMPVISRLFRAAALIQKSETAEDCRKAEEAIEEFARIMPKPEEVGPGEVAPMYAKLAKRYEKIDRGAQIALYEKVLKEYPAAEVSKEVDIELRKLLSVGQPFELAFTDAITGEPVDMANYRGKVVLVDFWATWCAPCIGNMPYIKNLAEKYKDQGLAIIGISLDKPEDLGGLEELRKGVKELGIDWPQYYHQPPSAQDFALKWGVVAIPRVFLVDHEGKLASSDAGPVLETMIPELLEKAAAARGAGEPSAPAPAPEAEKEKAATGDEPSGAEEGSSKSESDSGANPAAPGEPGSR